MRLDALRLAVESVKPLVATPGGTEIILTRAAEFAKYLSGETDTRPE